ncbi:MAG TPA: tellurite resistance/C4-dicarboxylate transporter family protein [Jatrophihabitans sp.]|nr:tellurite resistance/C4-dicarboxylate transporter family protein [Jatrophihabitans sp.]
MATGIVSVALSLAGFVVLSDTWLAVEITVWLALGFLIVARFLLDRPGWRSDAHTPAALTAVAASTMLGSGMSDHGWRDLAWTLLVLALLAWLVLTPLVLAHWRRPTIGNSFLVVVAVQGLVLLAGTLALINDDVWLADAVTVSFLVGLLAYLWVLATFDWTQIARGHGDHWVLTGSLAISALAGARVVSVTDPTGTVAALTNLHVAMRDVDLIVFGLCLAGYGVLVAAELRWPRWHYDVSRWATVFPLGMTAAAAMSVSTAASVGWLDSLGEVLVWPAIAVWIIVAVGAARSGRGRIGVPHRP